VQRVPPVDDRGDLRAVIDSSQNDIPFPRADGESVKVDHYRVALAITKDVANTGVSVDHARRKHELQARIIVLQLGKLLVKNVRSSGLNQSLTSIR
jgi:hypothetical protein